MGAEGGTTKIPHNDGMVIADEPNSKAPASGTTVLLYPTISLVKTEDVPRSIAGEVACILKSFDVGLINNGSVFKTGVIIKFGLQRSFFPLTPNIEFSIKCSPR